jgi:hypothetical protein
VPSARSKAVRPARRESSLNLPNGHSVLNLLQQLIHLTRKGESQWANETNQGQQSRQPQQGQKQNPSTQQPEQKKPNQAGDQGTDQAKQAPGREQEQGHQPTQRRDPATEQGDKDDQADGQKRKSA